MSALAPVKYNKFETNLFKSAGRQWDDATTGSNMFCLATHTYTPSTAHETTADVGANLITSGDGSPINVTTPVINGTTTPGTTYYSSDDADFGAIVTITAKYLICVQPVTAGTFSATTSKLLWYADLNYVLGDPTASLSSSGSDFKIVHQSNGWTKTT